jgi:hypothetical protein
MVGHHPLDPDAKARGKPSADLSISASKIHRLASTAVDQASERDGRTLNPFLIEFPHGREHLSRAAACAFGCPPH